MQFPQCCTSSNHGKTVHSFTIVCAHCTQHISKCVVQPLHRVGFKSMLLLVFGQEKCNQYLDTVGMNIKIPSGRKKNDNTVSKKISKQNSGENKIRTLYVYPLESNQLKILFRSDCLHFLAIKFINCEHFKSNTILSVIIFHNLRGILHVQTSMGCDVIKSFFNYSCQSKF